MHMVLEEIMFLTNIDSVTFYFIASIVKDALLCEISPYNHAFSTTGMFGGYISDGIRSLQHRERTPDNRTFCDMNAIKLIPAYAK